jgi:TPR repeat protein
VGDITPLHAPSWRTEALAAMNFRELDQAFGGDDTAEWLQAATNGGLIETHLRLGRMLLSGEGLPVDRRAAFACFLSASAGGNAEAQNLLGRCYENGWGIDVDRDAARTCYRQAAEKGDYRAAHNHACVLAAEGCVAGALHWFARGIGDAPEPARRQILKALSEHPRCAIRAFACRELGDPLVARTGQSA